MRNNDEKFSDNNDKSSESNKTVTLAGDGNAQDKKQAKFEPETTSNGVESKLFLNHMFL